MSNALAIASVTRALLDLLNDGMIDNDVAAAVGQAVSVSALPPDRLLAQQQANAPDPTQINIYLYHVTYNSAWRNADLPSRDARGDAVARPMLPLNLHYLLTAFGATDLQSEILLGYAMQLLHETPVLTREALRRTLSAGAVNPQILPAAYAALSAADIAEQFELVKLTPETMSLDEMSKVWTSIQAHHRTSVSYQASVVLIESRRRARTPLPVLTRGQRDAAGREPGVFVQGDMQPPVPTITAIVPVNEQLAARMNERVDIRGARLQGSAVAAFFTDPRTRQSMSLNGTFGAGQVSVQIPTGAGQGGADPSLGTDTDNWRCGVYDVNLRVSSGAAPARVTNTLPMVLAPTLTSIAAATNAGVTTFTIGCVPRIRPGQSVALIVGTQELPVEPFAAPTTSVQFRGRGFTAGADEWVRLRVDGIDSLLVNRAAHPPTFVVSDRVTIP
jgi:hypothetical protein